MTPQRREKKSALPLPAGVLAMLLLAGGVGCASVPMATAQQDLWAKQNLRPPIALHYLLSVHLLQNVVTAEWAPGLMVFAIAPQLARELASLRIVRWLTHPLVSLPVWLGTYFVWQEVKMGTWQAGSQLHLVDQATGRRALDECQLATSLIGPPPPAAQPMPTAHATAVPGDGPPAPGPGPTAPVAGPAPAPTSP